VISDDDAVAAARVALVGRVNPQPGAPVRVTREGAQIIVEFGRQDPPGTRGPDYDARVRLDAESGGILSILGGS